MHVAIIVTMIKYKVIIGHVPAMYPYFVFIKYSYLYI